MISGVPAGTVESTGSESQPPTDFNGSRLSVARLDHAVKVVETEIRRVVGEARASVGSVRVEQVDTKLRHTLDLAHQNLLTLGRGLKDPNSRRDLGRTVVDRGITLWQRVAAGFRDLAQRGRFK